jgi:hypothetical protein
MFTIVGGRHGLQPCLQTTSVNKVDDETARRLNVGMSDPLVFGQMPNPWTFILHRLEFYSKVDTLDYANWNCTQESILLSRPSLRACGCK